MSRNTIQTPREYIIRNMVPSPIDNVSLLTQDIMERANTSWCRGRARLWSVLVNFLSNDHFQNRETSSAHILFTIGSYIKIYVRLSTKLVYLWFIFQIYYFVLFLKRTKVNNSRKHFNYHSKFFIKKVLPLKKMSEFHSHHRPPSDDLM